MDIEDLVILTVFFTCYVIIRKRAFGKIVSHCVQRKFYKKNYYEMRGKVISFRDFTGNKGINDETYYLIEVKTHNEKTHHITTYNKKSRKYITKGYVTLLEPRVDVYKIKDEENSVIIKEDIMDTSGFIRSIILSLICIAITMLLMKLLFILGNPLLSFCVLGFYLHDIKTVCQEYQHQLALYDRK